MIDFRRGVELRAIRENNLEQLFRWRNDPRVWKWCRQNDVLHFENHKKWYQWQAQDPNTRMYAIWTGDQMVGVCGLTSIDWVNRRAEFSLYIDPDRQGMGYGRKALETLISHGFASLGLNSIWGETFDGNPASGMFEKVGFKREGTRRAFYFRNGRFIDCNLYSLLRVEWSIGAQDREEKKAPQASDDSWDNLNA